MTAVIDFCTPAVPGEVHKYYGDSHNKYIKLPYIDFTSTSPSTAGNTSATATHLGTSVLKKPTNKLKEHKTLRSVALSGNLALLRQFLQMVPDSFKAVNDPHPATGLTCLHFAASRGHLNIVICLVEEYAVRVDSTDNEGETALLKAAYNGHYHVVEYLLNSNANIRQKDKDGWTALHNACSRGYFRIVKLLVDQDAKVDVCSKMGHTPLINAASKGYMSIVEYLLDEAHANPLIKNNFGEAAYDVSAAAGESYICEMLEKAGRKWWHLQHTEGVLNPSNKRASLFGANYDILDFHVTVILILHENQRSTSLLGLSRPQFNDSYLQKTDTRGAWSLHPSGVSTTKDQVSLPTMVVEGERLTNWFWLMDWQIDYSDPRVDPTSGWQYAKSFDEDDASWTPVAPTSGYTWVRRRRWVRVMKRRMDLSKGSHRGENLTIANDNGEDEEEIVEINDYLLEAETAVKTVKLSSSDYDIETVKGDTNNLLNTMKEDLEKYNQAVEILTNEMKSDNNEFRKHQASTLLRSYMVHVDKLAYSIENLIPAASVTQQQHTREPNNEEHEGNDSGTSGNPWATINATASSRIDNMTDFISEDNEQHEPIMAGRRWESDFNAKACRLCIRKFGLLLRRHHCRKCGLIVCDKCSPWKVFLSPSEILQDPMGALEPTSTLAVMPQRVCDRCYHGSISNNH